MSSHVKIPDGSPSAFDSGFVKEESGVQSRGPQEAQAGEVRRPSGARALPGFETVTERTQRIDSKVAVARLLLSGLSPTDARARLLTSAMLRRDEVLLDAILAGMTEEIVALSRHPSRLPR